MYLFLINSTAFANVRDVIQHIDADHNGKEPVRCTL